MMHLNGSFPHLDGSGSPRAQHRDRGAAEAAAMSEISAERSRPPTAEDEPMADAPDDVDELEALESAARERWGMEWAIEQRHWADGTTSAHAYHIEPTEDPDVAVRDRLFLGADGDVYHVREQVRREEVIDVLERDEPPEEATSEFTVEK